MTITNLYYFFFFSSRRRHTRSTRDWSSDVCSSDLLWTGSLVIADTCYVLLVLAGGLIVMGHQTLQTSYAVKDIAPRLVVGFIAANLSLLLAGKAIQFADGISAALAGQGLDPHAAGQILRNVIYRVVAEGSIFFILLAVFAVVLVVVLTVIYVARLM